MITRIEIDPNIRVRGNGTFAGFEEVDGPLGVGLPVEVYEPEADIIGTGRITEIDVEKRLVYLSVDWASLRDPADHPLPTIDPIFLHAPEFHRTLAENGVSVRTGGSWGSAISVVSWDNANMQKVAREGQEIRMVVSA